MSMASFFTLRDLNTLIPSGAPDTLGINGLLGSMPPEFTIERLRFSLLAQLPGAIWVTGGRDAAGDGSPRGPVEPSAGECSVSLLISVSLISLTALASPLNDDRSWVAAHLGVVSQQLIGLLTAETSLLCAAAGSGLGIGLASSLRQSLDQLLALLLEAGPCVPSTLHGAVIAMGL